MLAVKQYDSFEPVKLRVLFFITFGKAVMIEQKQHIKWKILAVVTSTMDLHEWTTWIEQLYIFRFISHVKPKDEYTIIKYKKMIKFIGRGKLEAALVHNLCIRLAILTQLLDILV